MENIKRKKITIQRKLLRVIILTSGLVLILTSLTYFTYEFVSFRQAKKKQLITLGEIIAANSTAALAFDSKNDANEILKSLKADEHIVAAALYDKKGNLFSKYPSNIKINNLPAHPEEIGYIFDRLHLQGYQPVVQGDEKVGTLYLQSDLAVMYERFQLYGIIALMVILIIFLLAYLISRGLQKTLIEPILALSDTAKIISDKRDYSIRVIKTGEDEIAQLTESFNSMLDEIETQNFEINMFNQRLGQKVKERTVELEETNLTLNQQKEFVETIINSSIDLIAVFDRDLKYVILNKRSDDFYPIKREALLGKNILEVFPQVANSGMLDDLKNALKGETIYRPNYNSTILNKYFENYYIPLLDKTGEVYGVLTIGHDVTTIFETNEKLKTVNAKLVKSNQDLEQFAYVASHDLQEPLRKIRTFISLLQRNIADENETSKNIEKINSSATRMTEQIKAVLNYSRISNTEEQFEDVDLDIILENIKTDYELLISEKNAVISNDKLPVIKGIALQLNQLFSNLIGNSLKFSDQNPQIFIGCRKLTKAEILKHPKLNDNKHYIELLFKDSGIGFEQQYADKIFTIFQRLNPKQVYSGTGIGLALCKKIVENHHGYITAESQLGEGASFYIYLPVM